LPSELREDEKLIKILQKQSCLIYIS